MALTPLPHRDPVKLDKKDEGLFWLHAVDAVIVSSSHHVETAEEEVEVTVHHTQPNVTAKL